MAVAGQASEKEERQKVTRGGSAQALRHDRCGDDRGLQLGFHLGGAHRGEGSEGRGDRCVSVSQNGVPDRLTAQKLVEHPADASEVLAPLELPENNWFCIRMSLRLLEPVLKEKWRLKETQRLPTATREGGGIEKRGLTFIIVGGTRKRQFARNHPPPRGAGGRAGSEAPEAPGGGRKTVTYHFRVHDQEDGLWRSASSCRAAPLKARTGMSWRRTCRRR